MTDDLKPPTPPLGLHGDAPRRGMVWRGVRLVLLGIAQVAALVVASWLFSGVRVSGLGAATVAIAVLAVINALVWPVAVRLTAPLIGLTVGLFTFVLNGVASAAHWTS